MKLRLYGIVDESFVDGPGIRLTVFAQGCNKGCPYCQNKASWDYNGGTLFEIDEIIKRIDSNPLLDGVSFSGGEPFDQAVGFAELAKRIHNKGFKIITWSGYTYEEIFANPVRSILLRQIDFLVDGRFDIKKKSLNLKWRGSTNQRLIDVKRSLTEKKIVEVDDFAL